MAQTNSTKKRNLKHFLIAVFAIAAINLLSSSYFYRFDMTAEKRYSLTNSTKEFLRELDDVVYFRVYLEGDFPAEFRRLRNQTREMLDEFRAYSRNIQYQFINPLDASDSRQRQANIQDLVSKGLMPTQLQVRADDASSQQVIFPAALVSYKGYEVPVQLLVDQIGMRSSQMLNISAQSLEYSLITAIRQLVTTEKPRVAFLKGIGEPDEIFLSDIKNELEDLYDIENITLENNYEPLQGLEALIIAEPRNSFSEEQKFLIDQFVMHGGSCLWLISPVFADMDSLRVESETIGMAWPLNLDDMIFRYGARLNPDLLNDLHAIPIPITTGMIGNQPQISLVSWFFFPMILPERKHPIVRNLNALRTEFVSSIDTVGAPGVDKTILLETSPYTRVLQTPTRISLDILHNPPDEILFGAGPKTVAVLLEGSFESIYRNRIPPSVILPDGFEVKTSSVDNKMIVVSDGSIIKNKLDSRGQPLPLGYDRYIDEMFGNRDFILNAVTYLANDPEIMEARNKEIRLRPLDRTKVRNDKVFIQMANVLMPVVLLIIFGIVRSWLRKRKYTK